MGVEPTTSAMRMPRSSQLSYIPILMRKRTLLSPRKSATVGKSAYAHDRSCSVAAPTELHPRNGTDYIARPPEKASGLWFVRAHPCGECIAFLF